MLTRQNVKAKVLREEGVQLITVPKISMAVWKPVVTGPDLENGRERNQFRSSCLSSRPAEPLQVQ